MVSQTPPPRLEIVETLDRLQAVRGAWEALHQRAQGWPFQAYAWATADLSPATRLRFALAWRGPELIAAAPFVVANHKSLRILEWAGQDHTDYCDALIDPAADPAVIVALWRKVWARGGFDIARLQRLLPDAHARVLLAAGPGLRPASRTELSLRVQGPWASGEAWFESQTKKTRQNYRRGAKQLSEGAPCRFRLLPGDTPLPPVIRRLAALKQDWAIRQQESAPLFEGEADVVTRLALALQQAGRLRVFVLEREGEIIAISLNFLHGQTLAAFLTTYDPAFEKGSPGIVLMTDYIKWAFDAGLGEVDFLCGAEAFKNRYATQSVELATAIGPRTLVGAAALGADRIRRWVRAKAPGAAAAPEAAQEVEPATSA